MIVFIQAEWDLQPVFCAQDETIAQLKDRWGENYGIVEYNQRLIFGQRQLCDHPTLADYGIQDKSVLHKVRPFGRQKPNLLLECGICFEEFAKLAVLPCHHTGFCQECVADLNQCPLCRAPK